MNRHSKLNIQHLMPFLGIGIAIALIIGILIVFSYLFLWGLLIGGLLWLIAVIKNAFFSAKPTSATKGRVIEHDNKK